MAGEASEEEAAEAVALLRVPEWDAPDEVDVRFLEDGALVFLPVAFDADPDDLIDALLEAVGDAGDAHDDARGVFFFPDAAEPDDAKTYDAVIAAVGDAGKWIDVDAEPDLSSVAGTDVESLFGQAFQALGITDPNAFIQALQGGDPEAAKLVQIQMQGKLEAMMRGEGEAAPDDPTPKPSDPSKPEPKR
jgi:hypothetical protein